MEISVFIKELSIKATEHEGSLFLLSTRISIWFRFRKLLATKFQPTDARKAFPCFDEPKFKAVFKITIIHPINTTVLANFPIVSVVSASNFIGDENCRFQIDEKIENDLKRTRFADTFPMSTYLAAWAVLPPSFGKVVVHAGEIPVSDDWIEFFQQRKIIDSL